MTEDVLELIEGASLLVSAVGYWPSFHDASMHSIFVDCAGSTVTIVFYMNEMMDGGNAPDFLGKVILRWHEVEELSVSGKTDEQHWLWHLNLNRDGDLLETTLAPNDGIGGKIRAKRLEIVSCEPD